VHAASEEQRAGRIPDSDIEAALVATILGAIATPRIRPSGRVAS